MAGSAQSMKKETITEINQIDVSSKEGKYLMAALAVLTTEGKRTSETLFKALDELTELKEKMFPKE